MELPPEAFAALPETAQQYITGLQAAHDAQAEKLVNAKAAHDAQAQELANVNASMQQMAVTKQKQYIKAPKLPDPRTYNGSRNTRALRDYLYDVQQHFSNEPEKFTEESAKIRFGSAYLKGTAHLWFQNLEESGKAPWTTWTSYVAELEKSFAELDPLAYWQKKWDNLRQHGSVNNYLAEFSVVAAQLDNTEQAKYHHFYKGLRSNVQDQLALLPKPKTFTELVQLANQIDARFYENIVNKGNKQPACKVLGF
ncbi:unnamed protein product [Sympodiomycopsis kandeliae]